MNNPTINLDQFTREYMGELPQQTENQRALFDLALRYERYCESYDQSVCSRRDLKGVAIPITAFESGQINRNAVRVFKELMGEAEALGFTPQEFRTEIRVAQRYLEGGRV